MPFYKKSEKLALKLMTLLKAAVPHRDNDDVIRKVAVELALAVCSHLFICTLKLHYVDLDDIDVDRDALLKCRYASQGNFLLPIACLYFLVEVQSEIRFRSCYTSKLSKFSRKSMAICYVFEHSSHRGHLLNHFIWSQLELCLAV